MPIYRGAWRVEEIPISIDCIGPLGRYTDGRPRGCAPADSGTQARPSASSLTPIEVKAIVDKYCVGCHNERTKSGGLVLNTVDFTKVAANAEPLAKVVRKLGTGSMPPVGMPRPDKETHDALVSWLARELDRAAAAKPDPGRVILRRFRTEYANAIRDLLDLNIDVSALLPVDNSSYGFDNIGDVLGISPVLMERYVIAARRISAVAVGDAAEIPVIAETYRVRPDTAQDKHLEGLPSAHVAVSRPRLAGIRALADREVGAEAS